MATKTIAEAIAAVFEGTPVRKPERIATDEQVAAMIKRLGDRGYMPSESIVEPIRDYMTGYGVLLSGPAGVGKTFLMQLLKGHLRPVSEIMRYGLRDLHVWFDWTDGHEVCIDDLGAEPVTSEYGAKEDIMKLVITHRADRQSGRTSITTNLKADQIAQRYGDRTLSRILGMCKPHTIGGGNRRQPVIHETGGLT